jgi:hypothetical protein
MPRQPHCFGPLGKVVHDGGSTCPRECSHHGSEGKERGPPYNPFVSQPPMT